MKNKQKIYHTVGTFPKIQLEKYHKEVTVTPLIYKYMLAGLPLL